MGRLEGDDLRCMYHGLKFAPDGRCVEIPGQKLIPQSACVRRYPVTVRGDWATAIEHLERTYSAIVRVEDLNLEEIFLELHHG